MDSDEWVPGPPTHVSFWALYELFIALYDKQSYIRTMKVTALIPDNLISEVKALSSGKNITESLIIALKEWTSIQKLKSLSATVKHSPLSFRSGFTANKVRKVNRT